MLQSFVVAPVDPHSALSPAPAVEYPPIRLLRYNNVATLFDSEKETVYSSKLQVHTVSQPESKLNFHRSKSVKSSM
jgi:hypothetical protein